MSKRITYESKITDRDLAIAALKSLNMAYNVQGNNLRITSGSMQHAVINLKSGTVDSDSDYSHGKTIDTLKIAYTEAEARRNINRSGASITNREVITVNGIPGVVRLTCQKAVG